MRTFIFLLCSTAFGFTSSEVFSQNTKIHIDKDQTVSIDAVFDLLRDQTDYTFIYEEDLFKDVPKVQLKKGTILANKLLEICFSGKDFKLNLKGDKIIIIATEPSNTVLQTFTVSGTIMDSNGQPLPGANIVEKGTTNGVTADFDGNFSISVENEDVVLVVTYIGFATKEVGVNGQRTLNITLEESAAGLDEVVLIGYGSQKKSDLTGSVSNIKSKDLLDKPAVNVGQALSGKIAGVEAFTNSGRPDGKVSIRVRGNNSISASNEPLFVVDGVIGVSNINLINPNNIESLEVLKDASATAIYGARGANGVILITTKRGIPLDGESIISYDTYMSFGVLNKKQNLEFLNAQEWWSVYNTGYDNIQKYDPAGFAQGRYQRANPANLPNLFDSSGNPIYDTDWEDETYRTAVSVNHQLGFRGGNEKTTYGFFVNYLDQQALMVNNYLKRYSGQLNIDSQVKDWLKIGINASYNNSIGNDLYGNYIIKRLQQEALPIIPVKYPDGSWGSNRDFPGAVQDTPARYLEEMVNEISNSQFLSDLYLDFKITDDLGFKATFAVDNTHRKTNYYVGKNLIQFGGITNGGVAQISTEKQLYWQNENYFNYNLDFTEDSRLNVLLGLSWQQRYAELLGAEHRNFIDDFYQWHNIGLGTVVQPSSSSDWRWALNSYFARANYVLKDKYLFTATGRYDGSSKFGKNNRYAFFPSFAFAWKVSEENFLQDHKYISNLKLRTSIGQTGNQEIGNYAYSQNLGSNNVIFGDEFQSTLYNSNFGNPDLKWETTTQIDFGLDISLLNHRVDMTMDYYHKTTDDLLLNAPIPSSSGLPFVLKNIGSVRNKGFELSINSYNISSEDFSWSTRLSFATNKNRVIKLGENDEDILTTSHAQGFMKILRVGEPVGSFWGLTRLGTWGTEEAAEAETFNRLPGDLKYADINNDGKIDANDNSIIGIDSPKWTMGISNTLTYRNFDLLFDIRIVEGINVMNAGTHNREDRSGVANGSRTLLNAWTPENQNTMVGELRYMRTYYDSYPDTHWLQDGSFIRLQNLTVGYNFPKKILDKIGLDRLRLYASGQNLFLITKYNGYDPEISTFDGDFGQGIDDFGEPRARTYTLGLNVNF
ncbi:MULTISPECIES: TonB-dependent receptor [unclassified Arenibacter]|uniref:SusC/RagA family TonB-linked outer membrane protein n=1 Tax=unclassified Arenibacter TaxID=2615047 RepID=UPI000E348368|nr:MULTISPECIES: TonB-dependent receptor [unclassified Arenibacter]MCM4165409.1 SusC/RagA family TonB-linked outer membrane protein [Arenibacter sp. A80]RFT54992.1 TonB-dependent receptor [Arenibacter sp. P308M17]